MILILQIMGILYVFTSWSLSTFVNFINCRLRRIRCEKNASEKSEMLANIGKIKNGLGALPLKTHCSRRNLDMEYNFRGIGWLSKFRNDWSRCFESFLYLHIESKWYLGNGSSNFHLWFNYRRVSPYCEFREMDLLGEYLMIDQIYPSRSKSWWHLEKRICQLIYCFISTFV